MATATINTKPNGLLNGCAVSWHLWPQQAVVDGNIRHVGFEVELTGSHCLGPSHLDPGCRLCHLVRAALLAVAEDVVGNVTHGFQDSVTFEIDPHANSVMCSPGLGNGPFVRVSIAVFHKHQFERPIDPSEIAALDQIKKHLSELGIQQR